ncbi:hypothetical protein DICA3_F33628 [Diutina catenulata]
MSRRKRDYSRGGCRECKRRKIKCDERKPHCSKCIRLNKACTYPSPGETVLRVSKQYMEEHADDPPPDKPFTIQLYQPQGRYKKLPDEPGSGTRDHPDRQKRSSTGSLDHDHAAMVASAETLASVRTGTPRRPRRWSSATVNPGNPGSSGPTPQTLPLPPYQPSLASMAAPMAPMGSVEYTSPDSLTPSSLFGAFDFDDLQTLVTDVNGMVNDLVPEEALGSLEAFWERPQASPDPATAAGSPDPGIPSELLAKLATADERRYMQWFYREFAVQICPFPSYQASGGYINPLRDCLLEYAQREPYLLAAVVALGAKCAHDETVRTGGSAGSEQDAYWSYLSRCLTLLGPALTENQEKRVKDDLISNIESILLTVLLLASANASSHRQNWRPHLKGAKDIIVKATNSKIRQSQTLILCKMWFVDFEILAGTSSKLGGTLSTDFELDSVISFSANYEVEVLRRVGIIQENGFNVMSGYHYQCLEPFKELLKLMNRRKREGPGFIANDSLNYLELLSTFHRFYHTTYITRDGVLPASFAATYPGQPPNLIDVVEGSGDPVVVSWMDVSQQAYALAAIINISTWILQLPYDMPFVQDLVAKLIALISFLSRFDTRPRQYVKYSLSMLQWPMLVAGVNCVDEDQQALLSKYFQFSSELGSFSADLIFQRLVKLWSRRGREEYSEDDDIDVLTY